MRQRQTRSEQDELTLRDRELVALLALGLSNEQIAEELFIGIETVRSHLRRLFRRVGVSTRGEVASRAAGLGLMPTRTSSHDHIAGRRRSQHYRREPVAVRSAGLGIVRELMDEVFVERWRGRVRVVCRLRRVGPRQGTTSTGRSA
jgi:DNA-binding CsgD family transcriptional regulator